MKKLFLFSATLLLMVSAFAQNKVVFQDVNGADLADTVELFYSPSKDNIPFNCFITNTDTVNGYKIRLKRKMLQSVVKPQKPYAFDLLCIGFYCSELTDTIIVGMTAGSELLPKNSRISTVQPWDLIAYTPDTTGIAIYQYFIISETDQPDVFVEQDSVIIKYNSNGFVGVFDNERQNTAYIESYPNPVSDLLKIRYQVPVSSKVTASVYNILGRKIFEAELDGSTGISEIQVQDWKSGLYFITLESQGLTLISKKIIKK